MRQDCRVTPAPNQIIEDDMGWKPEPKFIRNRKRSGEVPWVHHDVEVTERAQ
jgi:hypothetical protein